MDQVSVPPVSPFVLPSLLVISVLESADQHPTREQWEVQLAAERLRSGCEGIWRTAVVVVVLVLLVLVAVLVVVGLVAVLVAAVLVCSVVVVVVVVFLFGGALVCGALVCVCMCTCVTYGRTIGIDM